MGGKAKGSSGNGGGGDPYAGHREPDGRLRPGHPGGPGRPSKARELAYIAILREILTASEFAFIVRSAILRAQNGDAQARQWLSDYAIGKPGQSIDVRHVDGSEPSLEEQFASYSDAELEAILAAAAGAGSGGTATGAHGGAGGEVAGGASGVAGGGGASGAGASEAG